MILFEGEFVGGGFLESIVVRVDVFGLITALQEASSPVSSDTSALASNPGPHCSLAPLTLLAALAAMGDPPT